MGGDLAAGGRKLGAGGGRRGPSWAASTCRGSERGDRPGPLITPPRPLPLDARRSLVPELSPAGLGHLEPRLGFRAPALTFGH